MKAILVGGSLHNQTQNISLTNPSIEILNSDSDVEKYYLFEVKNSNGVIYALYKHSQSTQKQINEILLNFN